MLDVGAGSMLAAAVAVASAQTEDDLRLADASLTNAAQGLGRSVSHTTGQLASEISALNAYADPKTGLPAWQAKLLAARAAASDASDAAERTVIDIMATA